MSLRLTLAWLVLLAPLFGMACAGPGAPDLVIANARVFTNDPAGPWAEAVAIRRERVVAVGDSDALKASAGASTQVIDAGGRVLVPGFNDARVDLPLEPPTPGGLSALDRRAVMQGVTSVQVIAGGPMRALVPAAQQATRQARWRLIRSPEDTATLSTSDPTVTLRQDDEPFLPPQPGVRLVANGVAWRLARERGFWQGSQPRRHGDDRRPLAAAQIETVVGWAYGAEDPIVMSGGAREWLAALGRVGIRDVWRRKRPRFDIDGPDDPALAPDWASIGTVVVWTPEAVMVVPGPGPSSAPTHYPGVYADAGLVVCLGSGGSHEPAQALAWAVGAGGRGGGRPLTREEAVRAMTWGSAYAEKTERDKGWLAPGTLADLAVLSEDVFAVPDERLAGITSVLTVVGGAIVYDPGGLAK